MIQQLDLAFSGHYIKNKIKQNIYSFQLYIEHSLGLTALLGHKTNLNKFKSTDTVSRIFSDHNSMKLEINHRKRNEKKKITWRLKQIGKGVRQGCILSPCLFNFFAEYIMRNARLDESQAGIKISERNINNLRYADNTTLMEESVKELKVS